MSTLFSKHCIAKFNTIHNKTNYGGIKGLDCKFNHASGFSRKYVLKFGSRKNTNVVDWSDDRKLGFGFGGSFPIGVPSVSTAILLLTSSVVVMATAASFALQITWIDSQNFRSYNTAHNKAYKENYGDGHYSIFKEEIKEQFDSVPDCAKEVANMLEVNKVQHCSGVLGAPFLTPLVPPSNCNNLK